MDELLRDLTIGILGSIIGAIIVYFGSFGVGLTREMRQRSKQKELKEINLWRTRKIQVRMEITNNYLFEILRYFLVGSILTMVPSLFAFTLGLMSGISGSIIYSFLAASTLLGVVYYFLSLGQVIRYLRIRRTDQDYLDTYLNVESSPTKQQDSNGSA